MKKFLFFLMFLSVITATAINANAASRTATAQAQAILSNYINSHNINIPPCNSTYMEMGSGSEKITCGAIEINGQFTNGYNYSLKGAPFSSDLKSALLTFLKGSGFQDDANYNMTVAFVNWLTPIPPHCRPLYSNINMMPRVIGHYCPDGSLKSKRLNTIFGLTQMINQGDIVTFNHLVQLFALHIKHENQ